MRPLWPNRVKKRRFWGQAEQKKGFLCAFIWGRWCSEVLWGGVDRMRSAQQSENEIKAFPHFWAHVIPCALQSGGAKCGDVGDPRVRPRRGCAPHHRRALRRFVGRIRGAELWERCVMGK